MKNAILRCFALLALIALVACGGGISKENYDKVKTGMTLEEVKDILGEPTDGGSAGAEIGGMKLSGGNYVWKDGDKTITIGFKDDKVVSKVQKGL